MKSHLHSFEISTKKSELLIEILYVASFSLHVGWCYFIYFKGSPTFITAISRWLDSMYASIGFDWSNHWSLVISSAMLSSLILNVIRRGMEGWLLGWPRYSFNSLKTLWHFALRALGYFVLFVLALGAYGELRSNRMLDGVEIIFLAISTFMFGLLVNVVDDFFSAVAQILTKGEMK